MELWQIIVMSVAALIIVGAIVTVVRARERSRHLREHFGPEYARTVEELGNGRRAEAELIQREMRIRKLQIRELTVGERQSFTSAWHMCQSQFVDNPGSAVQDADRLVREIMETRGYPVGKVEDEIANISAAYPHYAGEYREARHIVSEYGLNKATTEDLRKAFVHYRALFDEVLGGSVEEFRRAS